MERGHPTQARDVLVRIRGTHEVDAELADIADAAAAAAAVPQLEAWRALFRRAHRPQLVLSSLIPTFQQWWVPPPCDFLLVCCMVVDAGAPACQATGCGRVG